VVDGLWMTLLNAQNELDLLERATVGVQKRLHQDRHDAFSDSCCRANVSKKAGHKAVCHVDDIQDVAMGQGLPLCGLSLHGCGKQILVKSSEFETTAALVEGCPCNGEPLI
jgi:hypothetical protein